MWKQYIIWSGYRNQSGVNFINDCRAAFTRAHPESAKNKHFCQFLALWGSASIKAAHRKLMKLTPGVDFINVLRTTFTIAEHKITMQTWLSLFANSGSTCLKAVRRMLMKLSPGATYQKFSADKTYFKVVFKRFCSLKAYWK